MVQGVFDVTIMWLQTGIMFMLLALPVAKPKKEEEIPEFVDIKE